MLYRIAYQTNVGWFFWSDENYSTKEKAINLISAMPKDYGKNCFVVYPDRKGNWNRAE